MEIATRNKFGATANAASPSIPHPNREPALKKARLTAGFPNMVNGRRIDSSRTIKISDPVTGEELARVTDTRKDGLDQAVQAAKAAFPLWSSKTWNERKDLLANVIEELKAHTDELCTILTAENVLNVISGGDDLGPWMTSHPGFQKVSFTGSSETGCKVFASAAPTLKHLTLELGGNDAGIVLPDADPHAIAEPLFRSMFAVCGQGCHPQTPFCAREHLSGSYGSTHILCSTSETRRWV
jgi:acyl-CoA reductase-like NAD-dependent aldehyde dehydrogenase